MTYTVIRQDWTEYEEGWGQRPDDPSLHIDLAAHRKFMENRDKRLKKLREQYPNMGNSSFDDTCGRPYPMEVSKELYEIVKASKTGLWFTINLRTEENRRRKGLL